MITNLGPKSCYYPGKGTVTVLSGIKNITFDCILRRASIEYIPNSLAKKGWEEIKKGIVPCASELVIVSGLAYKFLLYVYDTSPTVAHP